MYALVPTSVNILYLASDIVLGNVLEETFEIHYTSTHIAPASELSTTFAIKRMPRTPSAISG